MVVIIITVDEHYHVGILLDGSGLTQIGKHRAVIRPLLHGSRELGECNYRHGKLSCECLEGSGNILNLLLTGVCRLPGTGHELQVVDDDQFQIML